MQLGYEFLALGFVRVADPRLAPELELAVELEDFQHLDLDLAGKRDIEVIELEYM